jgi:methionine aminotransferase
MREGRNQYPPMAGMAELRAAIAAKVAALYGVAYDVDSEITVTAGATQATLHRHRCVCPQWRRGHRFRAGLRQLRAGDRDRRRQGGLRARCASRLPAGLGAGSLAAQPADADDHHQLTAQPDRQPAGSRRSGSQLAELTRDTDIVLLSDEVYEHIVFDGARTQSVAAHPELAARSLVVSSFGKTYHITGWKVGYVLGPSRLMAEFRKVHQFNVFTVNTPCQLGIAEYMRDASRHLGLAAFYQGKREFFRSQLRGSRFELLACRGTYFQLARYRAISDLPDREFAQWLTREAGVAVIPVSVFYRDGRDDHVVRFCFAKQEATLAAAGEKLRRL